MKVELTANDISYLQSALDDALFCFENLKEHKNAYKNGSCYTCKQYRRLKTKFKKFVNQRN